ncbi:S-layer homology domain-containing protein [Brasilonema bromeliae]|uniref:S-layer homology domain-containing protein n=1 Tax=Brasilonema bromeliae SPC951 TaxID=385972 RepID=A0ABX1PB66_9CYAN|nr:S-layer homology domain-containing protein [Brasilonema bromeliae]NMG21218.1 S-layer homology domain-containing protein [Brasilonema bromeliae SPC951]
MRQLLGTLSLLALLQLVPNIVSAQEKPSTKKTSNSIARVVAAKVMTNYPDGQFYPERLLSRAELASILVKAFHLEKRQAVTKENVKVTDVPPSNPAFNDIQIVLKTDIMKGYRGNLFFPNQRITRAEALAIFAQAYGVFQFPDQTVNEILSQYPDAASIPGWAKKAIATAATEGFINTDTQGNLSPSQPMTRGEMAHILSKYLQRQQPQAETPEVPGGNNNPESSP